MRYVGVGRRALEIAIDTSLGKFALGIRVVRLDGQPMDGFTSFLRNIIRAVDGVIFCLVGAIFIWNSSLRQCLGDMVARTVVVPAALAATHQRFEPSQSYVGTIPPRPDR
jgi:uncharacterized RDD family membrane protein YckC